MPAYPPTTSQGALNALLEAFTDYALSHGVSVRPPPTFSPNPHNALSTAAPIALYPSLFPRSSFTSGLAVQPAYNAVYAAIAADSVWLGRVVADLAAVDTFMASLYSVYLNAKLEGFAHEFSLGLFRSDYMVHRPTPVQDPTLLQVEFNTIASSFGGLASRVSELHRFLLKAGVYPPSPQLTLSTIPRNPAAAELAAGLAAANTHYGPTLKDREKAVLFIVQPEERNAFDQRWLEYALLEHHSVRTHRITLADVQSHTHLDGPTRRLVFSTPLSTEVEISTVYFRAGYGPGDYPTAHEWAARLHLERSRAIKCPTIAIQLAGVKKVQQELAVPGVLERFSASPEDVAAVRATFAAIYPLDTTTQGLAARKLAFENPERYVLKPQREGGGNNVYRGKIPDFLKSLDEELWAGYILMELIEPPPAEGVIVRNGEVARGGVVSELGVYGVALWREDTGKMVVNKEAGWLLRTKGAESEEGGVAAGFGCVDGVCLVD